MRGQYLIIGFLVYLLLSLFVISHVAGFWESRRSSLESLDVPSRAGKTAELI